MPTAASSRHSVNGAATNASILHHSSSSNNYVSPIRRETEDSVSDPSLLYRVLLKEEELRNRSLSNENGALKAEVRVLQVRSRANVFSRLDASRQHQQQQHRQSGASVDHACCVPNCYRNRTLNSTSSMEARRSRSIGSPQRSQSARPVVRRSSLRWADSNAETIDSEYVNVPLVSPSRDRYTHDSAPLLSPTSQRNKSSKTKLPTTAAQATRPIITSPPRRVAADDSSAGDQGTSPKRNHLPSGAQLPSGTQAVGAAHVTSLSPAPYNPKSPPIQPTSPLRSTGAQLSPRRSPLKAPVQKTPATPAAYKSDVHTNRCRGGFTTATTTDDPTSRAICLHHSTPRASCICDAGRHCSRPPYRAEAIASHITFENSTTSELYASVRKQIYRLKRRMVTGMKDMSQLQHMVSLYQDTASARISAAHEAAMSGIAGAMMSSTTTTASASAAPHTVHQARFGEDNRSNTFSRTHGSLRSSYRDAQPHEQHQRVTSSSTLPAAMDRHDHQRPPSSYAFSRPLVVEEGQHNATSTTTSTVASRMGKVFNSSVEVERNQQHAFADSGAYSSSLLEDDDEEPLPTERVGQINNQQQQQQQQQQQIRDHILCQHDDHRASSGSAIRHQEQHLYGGGPSSSTSSPTRHYQPRQQRQHGGGGSPSRKEVWIGGGHNQSTTSITVTTDDDVDGDNDLAQLRRPTSKAAQHSFDARGGIVNVSTTSSAATSSKAALLEAIRAAAAAPRRLPPQQSSSLRSSGGIPLGGYSSVRRSVDPLDIDQLLSASTVLYSPSQYRGSPQQQQHRQPRQSQAGVGGGGGSAQNSLMNSDASFFSTLRGDTDLDRYMKWKADFTQRLASDEAPAAGEESASFDAHAQHGTTKTTTSTSALLQRYRSTEQHVADDTDDDDGVNLSSPTF
ncbi:Hypothetical protein, putative [Bodo saltans]|uniref:Uncharacterized protein n=1 Tax=Bodo saltans TaxID=75058 RepID=A0A0S4JQ95_BODSA|nr:Hypothetical protein, putative [Bodo saltans]|eukprot:CUG92369.1 Hypothetical protein, putative [Bodo saltans]